MKFLSEEDMDITTPIQYILYRDTDYYEISRMKINFNDFTSNSYFDRAFKGLNSEAMMQTAEIKEFAPKIFGRIKHELGYTKEMISRALAPIDNRDLIDPAHNYNKGKSSSFIFIDHSEKFVVKSISQKERKYFIKYMIKGYSHRVLHDRNSRLVRIIGLYQFNRNKGNIIIMENVIPNLHSAYLFDLKGSTHDRQTIDSIESIQKGVICKDLDFKLFSETCEIDLCLYESVMQSIAADCEFLKNAGIMDYSLLCGIYDDFSIAATRYSIFSSKKVFNLAIIDILQQYNIKKKTEKRLKEMIYNSEVSSSDPVTYAERFLSFVKENVFRVQLGEE